MLCSVVKHAGCGQSTKEASGETRDLVECFNTLIEHAFSTNDSARYMRYISLLKAPVIICFLFQSAFK